MSREVISSIAPSGNSMFTVAPVTGLKPGTYTAIVMVSSASLAMQAFDVSFTVTHCLHLDLTTVTIDATCVAEGSITVSCSRCEYEDVTVIPMTSHNFVITINATCWAGNWDTKVCSLCDFVELDANGQQIIYGWRGALGHDYELTKRTTATCWSGGGDFVECKRCGYDTIINWTAGLGHRFGTPQATANPLWNIVHCERDGCGHSEFRFQARVLSPAQYLATCG